MKKSEMEDLLLFDEEGEGKSTLVSRLLESDGEDQMDSVTTRAQEDLGSIKIDDDNESVITHTGDSEDDENDEVWSRVVGAEEKKKKKIAARFDYNFTPNGDIIRNIWGGKFPPPPPLKEEKPSSLPRGQKNKPLNVVYRLTKEAHPPKKAYEDSPLIDLFCQDAFPLPRGSSRKVRIGNEIDIPPGHLGFALSRPGLACKHGIAIVGGLTTIVPNLDKMISVMLKNDGDQDYYFQANSPIACLTIARIPETKLIYGGLASEENFEPDTFYYDNMTQRQNRGNKSFMKR